MATSSCRPAETLVDPTPEKPYQGVALTVTYSSEVIHPGQFEEFARAWSLLNSADVKVKPISASSMIHGSDISLVSYAQMPALASRGQLPLPADLRYEDSKYQWNNILSLYSNRLSRWNGEQYALPLTAEGWVLVYRVDLFDKDEVQDWTWEKLPEIARKLQAKKPGPVFPRLPARAVELENQFYAIASCYDRRVMTQAEEGGKAAKEERAIELASFQYEMKARGPDGRFVDSYQPRIAGPAFVQALSVLRAMQPFRPSGQAERPAEDFRAGTASICIAQLDELYRLQQPDSPVCGKFGIAPLPGSGFTFNFFTGKREENPPHRLVNRVPYQGWGGVCATISEDCAHPDAALAFLTALGNPDRNGQEAIVASKWGNGPYRSTQLEESRRFLWLGYDLSTANTLDLINVLREHVDPSLLNATCRLRTPNQEVHVEALTNSLRRGLSEDTKVGSKELLEGVAVEWNKLWSNQGEKKTWLRLNAGWER